MGGAKDAVKEAKNTAKTAVAGKARPELGWEPQHTLEADMPALIEDFIASGRLDKEVDFSADDKVLQTAGAMASA